MTAETLPVAVPLEPTTPIKPSEAIRLGRLLIPARTVRSLAKFRRGEPVAVCALGAMAVGFGAGGELPRGGGNNAFWWPGGMGGAPRLPSPCVCYPRYLNFRLYPNDPAAGRRFAVKPHAFLTPVVVAHLSDEHGGRGGHSRLGDYWPTSRIADWLAEQGL